MRAVVKTGSAPGCELVADWREAALREGEVRVEVGAASLCGTDLALAAAGSAGGDLAVSFPRVLGHEVSGVVVEVGPRVLSPALGARVALESHVHCGTCWFCRSGDGHNCSRLELLGLTIDGGFAERLVVPARSCYVVPDSVSTEAAALLESAGSAVHGILRSAVDVAGTSVLVTGAGPVGLAAAQAAAALGAREVCVVEPHPGRRQKAETYGARAVGTDVDALEQAGPSTRSRGGFDLALECSGSLPALATALASVRREATVVTVGLVKQPVSVDVAETLISRGVTLKGSWGRSIWRTWDTLVHLVERGQVDLDSLVGRRLPLAGFHDALDAMGNEVGKIVLLPSLDDEPREVPVAADEPVGAG